MPVRHFDDAGAFRQSLEERLRQAAESEGGAVNTVRLKLLMERLLARLFVDDAPEWLLKGGYAMELRFRPRARTTKDLDLAFVVVAPSLSAKQRLDEVRERLQVAAALELGDHLVYRIGEAGRLIEAAAAGGARFPVVVMLAGREYGRFHVDVGIGPAPEGRPERLVGSDLLAFAGLTRVEALAVARETQFAEKIHSYTRPWGDRENTRTKDLVDLLLLVEASLPSRAALVAALKQAFAATPTRCRPRNLPPPPRSWADDFAALAGEVQLSTSSLDEAFAQLSRFWQDQRLGAEDS